MIDQSTYYDNIILVIIFCSFECCNGHFISFFFLSYRAEAEAKS